MSKNKNSRVTIKKFESYLLVPIIIFSLLFFGAKEGVKANIEIAEVSIAGIGDPPAENPKIEYIELYVEKSGKLDNYRLVNSNDKTILQIPTIDVEEGETFCVFTGKGEDCNCRLYIGLNEEVWNDEEGIVKLYKGSKLIESYTY